MQAARLLEELRRRGLRLAVAESFTGGLLMDRLTDVPGSSDVFLGGVVAYHNQVKQRQLRVPAALLREHGAVSARVAEAMAEGVRRAFRADVGIATTGIAGPAGATQEKPVGLSFVAVSIGRRTWVGSERHMGGRRTVKEAAVGQALELVAEALRAHNG